MRTHIIENGIVVNTIEVESIEAAQGFFPGAVVIEATEGSVGWLWNGTTLSEPPVPPKTRDELKGNRSAAVGAIKVTTTAGNTFDGDEISQGRMARAILALSTGLAPSVTWVLADNSTINATAAELTEALVLAGQAQAAIWVIE